MGWAFCGTDSKGRQMGYGVEAECDHPECQVQIDRGLGYCCGSMHEGSNEDGCGGYYCGAHGSDHDCEWLDESNHASA